MELNEPISVVKNIGETRCKQLNKMGVECEYNDKHTLKIFS